MRRTVQRRMKITVSILLLLFITAGATFYYYRDELLQRAIAQVTRKLDTKYNSTFNVEKAQFKGLSAVSLSGVSLVPKNQDTLLYVDKMETSISFLKLMVGDVQLGELKMNDGFVQLVKDEKGKNYSAFISLKSEQKSANESKNYAKIAYRLITKALDLVPTDMALENISLKIKDFGKSTTIDFKKLTLEDKELESLITVQTDTFFQRWNIKGFADPRNKEADISFTNADTGAIRVPYIDERFHLKSSFDKIQMKIFDIDKNGDELSIKGYSSISNLTLDHAKIAGKPVVIKNAQFDYRFLLGEDFVSIDSSSTAHFNKIKFHPYLAYETGEDTIYRLKAKIPKMQAQDFITSLPDGLFTNFQGMQATGSFDYELNVVFNKNKPKDLTFDVKLNKENLKILKYGAANLSKLNDDFVYRAIIDSVPQRPIMVGPSNPNFVRLNQISPYLQKCVLTTEDPSFFSHKGFVAEAFKQSVIQNIKTKKFSRGASTISMQLIKNVFLTREKTLSRKLEEILLVYILENNRIVSKQRMLEVYFNIIEWGPNIYGIGEASRFYFQKHPSELNLNECLFLANIIPSPKKFMYKFNDQGNLKDFMVRQQRYLTNLMQKRGWIVADSISRNSPVYISGPARSYIKIREVIPVVETDSLAVDEEFEF